jgi:hypothetical protein
MARGILASVSAKISWNAASRAGLENKLYPAHAWIIGR